MEQPLLIERHDAARTVTLVLNRPEKRNALDLPLLQALREAIEKEGTTGSARAVILRGNGPAFCSGMDLAATAGVPHETAEAVRAVLLALSNCPLVTIAAVEGHAVAGGAGLVAACDFAVMAAPARIGYPEVRRGLVAALVSVFLRRQISERDVRELLLGADLVSAERAGQMGLVNRVVPTQAEVLPAVAQIAAQAAQGGPEAIKATKHLLHALHPRSLEEETQIALDLHRTARDSAEAREGAAAFLEKRPPAWTL
ncbi:MAG: enoyl-CoA hydratase/isomerase family protein [Verrucomicrobia bacterium]|nr:enoyl-CoA hydratase/isomerase family protein [Verrucomicrobiota bacterium]